MKAIDIDSRLKPLYVSLKKVEIGRYLSTKDFQHFVISENIDAVWVKCLAKARLGKSIFGVLSKDWAENEEALGYFLDAAYDKWDIVFNEKYFGNIILPILTRFITWNDTQVEISEISSNLKKMGVPNEQLIEFTKSIKGILLRKPKYLPENNLPATFKTDPKKVFIVHGHNKTVLHEVSNVISKIELIPIVLHEQVNNGQTIIEKFEKHSDVGAAIVILTADDLGKSKTEECLNNRARQNVILELGYFIGKLGRNKVIPLYERGVEIPSDFNGVIYEELDSGGNWKFKIIRELNAIGYNVDANKIL